MKFIIDKEFKIKIRNNLINFKKQKIIRIK